MVLEFPVRFPRHAFSPREAARAGDVWRVMQEVAVEGSTRCGWSPGRYREAGVGFVVRSMRCVHAREAMFGEPIGARTWVGDFRRRLITRREIRLEAEDGRLAAATQEWVHVRSDLKLERAGPELATAFQIVNPEPPVELPRIDEEHPGPEHELAFSCWHTWMDPFAHANHPLYVDWCDEALSRVLAGVGLDPVALKPVAEQVLWRTGIVAGQQVRLQTRRVGRAGDAVVCAHTITLEDGTVAAEATTVRTLIDGGGDALALALDG